MLANFLVPILPDGWRFIALFAAATFLAALTGVAWLFWPLFLVTLWSIYFFRDPSRGVPQDDGLLIAPADGLVQMVVDAVPPAELGLGDKPLTRVSIFLSVFDVHINRRSPRSRRRCRPRSTSSSRSTNGPSAKTTSPAR